MKILKKINGLTQGGNKNIDDVSRLIKKKLASCLLLIVQLKMRVYCEFQKNLLVCIVDVRVEGVVVCRKEAYIGEAKNERKRERKFLNILFLLFYLKFFLLT